jgi:hypothetical protein
MLLLVTYEAPPGAEDRTAAIQQLINEHAGGRHVQPLVNRWIIETDEPVNNWMERIGGPGRLIIVRLRGTLVGYLPQDMWDWINPREG